MSIKDSAYQLAKAVKISDDREKLRGVLGSLLYNKGINDLNDRSHFGYLARQQQLQFFGYLLVDLDRAMNPTQGPLAIPELEAEERSLLAAAHETWDHLGKACLKPVTAISPDLRILVDLYSRYNYQTGNHRNKINLIPKNALNRTVQNFSTHPAIAILNSALERLKGQGQPFDFKANRDLILQFEKDLKSAGPIKSPPNLHKMFQLGRQSEVLGHFFQVMFSIISIKASLDNLRQILYQAVLSDRLAVLSQDNVFDVSGENRNLATSGEVISYQPDDKAFLIEPNDIVLVKIQTDVIQIDTLCLTGGISLSFSRDLGNSVKAELWELDDSLNPYEGLLQMFP